MLRPWPDHTRPANRMMKGREIMAIQKRTVAAIPLIFVLAVSLTGLTVNTSALAEFSDTGRGERPQLRTLSTYELRRMSDDALLDLQFGGPYRIEVKGVMGRYSNFILITALRLKPGPTGRLIERIENARNDAERKAIIAGLLRAAKRRLEAGEAELAKEKKVLDAAGLLDEYPTIIAPPRIRDNKRVQAYYALLRANHAESKFIQLLESMWRTHAGFSRVFLR